MPTNASPFLPMGTGAPQGSSSPGHAPAKRGLTTGRKILVFPSGTLHSAIRSMDSRTRLKRSSIASINDTEDDQRVSVAQFFSKNSGAQALTFDELGVMVVNDVAALGGLSPASVGGPMPVIGDEHYVYPSSQGSASGLGSFSVDELKQLDEMIQKRLRGYANPGQSAQLPAAAGGQQTWNLNAVQALSSKFTGKNIRVAVIDTGIDPGHPDLKGKIAHAWSFDNGPVNDDIGHGTHVAGTIAGSRSDPIAYAMAPDVQLYIAKVFRSDGAGGTLGGTDSDVIGAINWAIKNQCHVANMSLSSRDPLPLGTKFDPAFEAIAQNALSKGLLLVAAAGNASNRPGFTAPVGHPANCPSVLAVAALDRSFQVPWFSNAGQADPSDGQINFSAPGVDIFSAWPTNMTPPTPVPGVSGSYSMDQGTSMAAPHITGLAALVAEKLGGTGGLLLWQALVLAPIEPLTGLSRIDVGFGMLKAVQS